MPKQLVILGSTGSVGQNTLKVVKELGGRFRVRALTAHDNWQLLARQARSWQPDLVAAGAACARKLQRELHGSGIRIVTGSEGISAAATHPEAELVVSAIVGTAGLRPTLEAVQAGKDIALANKETLVAAGGLVTREAQRSQVRLIPVDSEHSAIFQCLQGVRKSELKRIILTASGGPFRGQERELLVQVTPEEAVAHPRWDMGQKISVDSATLMNKGLEVIEARWLFDLPVDRIDVVVHPQSIIHSLVELVDGALLAQLNLPDMRHPIQYALTYPQRLPAPTLKPLKLADIGKLTFEEPDLKTFECLQLALAAARVGGTMPAVMNAANEAAVAAFLEKTISFLDIARLVRQTMEAHTPIPDPELENVLSADDWARTQVRRQIEGGEL